MRKVSIFIIFWCLLCFGWGNSSVQADVEHLLISEVLYDPDGVDQGGEWVELFNPFSYSVDLADWYLRDNYRSFALSGSIEPLEHYLISQDSDIFTNKYGFAPGVSGMNLSLANSGDFIKLIYLETEIDTVGYEGGDGVENPPSSAP